MLKMMMKLRWLLLIASLMAAPAMRAADVSTALPKESPHDLMKDVVYNELQDRQRESYWQYRSERRETGQVLVREQVETSQGPVNRLLALNGKPLDGAGEEQERLRLNRLMNEPSLQARVKRQHEEDEQRLIRLMTLLPGAFLYDYDGVDNGLLRLHFRPNPEFKPPTYEARIFHALAGTVWVNPQQKRLAHLSGSVLDRVDFGYGLLGYVNPGGKFELARQQVSGDHWKTSLVEVHITGRVILFKTVTKDQREARSGFRPVPAGITLAEAKALLEHARTD